MAHRRSKHASYRLRALEIDQQQESQLYRHNKLYISRWWRCEINKCVFCLAGLFSQTLSKENHVLHQLLFQPVRNTACFPGFITANCVCREYSHEKQFNHSYVVLHFITSGINYIKRTLYSNSTELHGVSWTIRVFMNIGSQKSISWPKQLYAILKYV